MQLVFVVISLLFSCHATVVFYTAPNDEISLSSGFGYLTDNAVNSLTDDLITNFAVTNIEVLDENYLIAYGQIGYLGNTNTLIGSILLYNISSQQWSIFGKNNLPALTALEINGVAKVSPDTIVVVGSISVLGNNPNINLNNVALCNIPRGECSAMGDGISDYNDILLDVVVGDGMVYVYYVNTLSEYIITAWDGSQWNTLLRSQYGVSISIMAIMYANNLLYALSPKVGSMEPCEGETIHYVGVWNGSCWSSMKNSENTGGLLMIGVTEQNTIYGINTTQYLLRYENEDWIPLMQLPEFVQASQSFWAVSEDLILIECFLSDKIHTSIGLINLTTLTFHNLSEVVCGINYGPSFTIYNGSIWYLCRHSDEISITQYDHSKRLHTHISSYGPVYAPVSKVSGLCPFGEKLLVWAVMSRISYAGEILCNQSIAVWNSTAWIVPPFLEGFDPQWTYGYGVSCGAYESDLVLVFNYNNTIRLAIIDHDSFAVTYYDPPSNISIPNSYYPDIYVDGSFVYIVSYEIFMFDIITNNWAQLTSFNNPYTTIYAVAATEEIVYIGGSFQVIDSNNTYNNIVKFNKTSRQYMPIVSLNGTVKDIKFGNLSKTDATVYVVGSFSGPSYSAIVGLDTSGAIIDYAVNGIPKSQCTNIIYDSGIFYLLCGALGTSVYDLKIHSYDSISWQPILPQETVYSIASYNYTLINHASGHSSLKWYWYLIIALGSLLVVSIIVSIVFVLRRRKQYQLLPQYEELGQRDKRFSMRIIKEVSLLEQIGSGQFGNVYKALMDKSTLVAVKVLKSSQREELVKEVGILCFLNHPNIVHFYGIHNHEDQDYMVFEYLPEGNLSTLVQKKKNSITLADLYKMCQHIIYGMKYLQENHIIHRDLACRNVLVTKDSEGKYVAKISDFGLSRAPCDDYYRTDDKTMPVKWSAIEAIQYGLYTSKSDVWSFGVCLWELFSYGQMPYQGMSNGDTMKKVADGYRMESPVGCPEEVYSLMLRCWDSNPDLRPSFQDLAEKFDAWSATQQIATFMANPIIVNEEDYNN